ncbi:MAG: hypothetical protein Q7T18_07275 [Sedimentisphaerales bacterium]|nr:hypothetical protein [Sedimentisphaerales bacterium]
MSKLRMWLIVLVAVMAGGCCSRQCAAPPNKICVQGGDVPMAMDAAQKTLEDMHFTIEKADANAGYISTRPLPAGQFFEPWRSDTVGCSNFAEANLHSVIRIAQINVTPQNGDVCIECTVETRRLSMPQREVNSATELMGAFSRNSRGSQSLKLSKGKKEAAVWMDMGPDAQLQAKILELIGKQIGSHIYYSGNRER